MRNLFTMTRRTSIFLILLSSMILSQGSTEEIKVTALIGGVAELPCDITSNNEATSVILVVWYKDELPVYSWDARVASSSTTGQHWAGTVLGNRAKWSPRPARLALRPVKLKDGGIYKCRADFRAEPSRFTNVRLVIIEAPAVPKIYDEDGKEVIGKAGPFKEGDSPVFFCVVTGGNPPPTVRWFRDDEILPTTEWAGSDEYGSKVARHRSKGTLKPMGLPVRVPSLRREDLLSKVSCRANNSHLLPTLSSTVVLDMHLPPQSIEILPRDPLRAGRNEILECKVIGARPPAKLHWLLNGIPLATNNFSQQESNTEDISISQIILIPGRDQRGQQLTCKATHILQPPLDPLTFSTTLDILLPPDVSLTLGGDLSIENINAGDTVALECSVLAHPPPYKISWEHNGRTIAHEPTARDDWGRLTLSKIQPEDSGSYSCTASNVEGDTKSNLINIQVLHSPICRLGKDIKRAYILLNKKEVELVCEVSAHPPPTNFTWALNTSSGLVTLPRDKYSWIDATSKLRFLPTSNMLQESSAEALCWANNKIGRQQTPCALSLDIPVPPAPKNCALHNLTASDFALLCDKDNDPLTKNYELTVQVSSEKELLANLTTNQPVFRVSGLPGGKELRLLLYAIGTHKRSNPTELFIIMPQTQKIFKGSYTALQTILLLILMLALILLLSLGVAFLKYRNKLFERFQGDFKSARQAATGVREAECSSVLHEERNPDVVPLKKDQNGTVQMRAEEEWEVSARSPRLDNLSPGRELSVPEAIGTWSIRTHHGREVVTSCTPLPLTQESCV